MEIYHKTLSVPCEDHLKLSDVINKETKKEIPKEIPSFVNSYEPITISRDEIHKMKVINQVDKKFIILLYQNHL